MRVHASTIGAVAAAAAVAMVFTAGLFQPAAVLAQTNMEMSEPIFLPASRPQSTTSEPDDPMLRNAPHTIDLPMTPGLVRLIELEQAFATILIGDDRIADTNVVSEFSVAIVAREAGQTTIIFLDDDNQPILSTEVMVVPSAQGLNRRPVTVRMFGGRGNYEAHTYFCLTTPGSGGACSFGETRANRQPTPVISTGPVITAGEGAQAASPD